MKANEAWNKWVNSRVWAMIQKWPYKSYGVVATLYIILTWNRTWG